MCSDHGLSPPPDPYNYNTRGFGWHSTECWVSRYNCAVADRSNRPRRRSLRLPGWDYRAAAYYFVTICTHGRHPLFDDVALRDVIALTWQHIPLQPRAHGWLLDEWVVMPNHLHGILLRPPIPDASPPSATPDAEQVVMPGLPFDMRYAGDWGMPAGPTNDEPSVRRGGVKPGALGAVVGTFKSEATRRINALRRSPGDRVWQRGFYERIVRNDRELANIRVYIHENPERWAAERENLDELLARMSYREG